MKDLIRILNKEGIKTGVNLLVTHADIPNIGRIIPDLAKLPVDDIVVLRAKPGKKVEWFNENKLRKGNLETLKRVLETHRERVRVDCSLVCLMRHTLPELLQRNAVYGCVAGVRFCTIKSDGDVFPCSFFDGKEYCAGNVLEKGFRDIWNESTVFKKFRAMNQMLQGACKSCGIREYCKGCRRIAVEESGDFYSQEILCS